ncbi:unnamed protein product [Linum tenue]|uniref:Secreted protein n=1 Tax=Linum tenue TaxID=586396 RepID=A0AAV0NMM1_9ROSI|nr:unnamed protein product [Linum tenue]
MCLVMAPLAGERRMLGVLGLLLLLLLGMLQLVVETRQDRSMSTCKPSLATLCSSKLCLSLAECFSPREISMMLRNTTTGQHKWSLEMVSY